MHLSDTLVIGPLPLQARPVRVPLGTAIAVGHALVLSRPGAPDVLVLDPSADVAIPIWPRVSVLPIRAPLPGSAITDLQVLADGRLGLAVASLVGPTERQAWVFDPVQSRLQRVGPATRDAAPPAGVV